MQELEATSDHLGERGTSDGPDIVLLEKCAALIAGRIAVVVTGVRSAGCADGAGSASPAAPAGGATPAKPISMTPTITADP